MEKFMPLHSENARNVPPFPCPYLFIHRLIDRYHSIQFNSIINTSDVNPSAIDSFLGTRRKVN